MKKHSLGVDALEVFITSQTELRARDEKMILVLRLHICIVEMYLKVYPLSLEHGEMAWDNLEVYFLKLIRLGRQILGYTEEDLAGMLRSPSEVEGYGLSDLKQIASSKYIYPKIPTAVSILKTGEQRMQTPVFAFSQGVIGPLSTTALLCRTPSIRQEAIALLLLHPRREGLWDSHTAGRMGWVSMCLEEELTRQYRGETNEKGKFQIKTASEVPLECRIKVDHMQYLGPRVGEVRFTTMKEVLKGENGRIVKIMEW